MHKDQICTLATFLNTCSTTVLSYSCFDKYFNYSYLSKQEDLVYENENICDHRSEPISFWSFTPRFLTPSYVLTVYHLQWERACLELPCLLLPVLPCILKAFQDFYEMHRGKKLPSRH